MQRTRETRKIGDHTVELEKLPPRRALAVMARLIATIGAPASAGLSDPDKLEKMLGSDLDWKVAGLWFVTNALPGLDALKPDEVVEIADDLVIGKLILDGTAVETGAQLDAMLDDLYVYLRIVRFAIELTFRPTGAGGVTSPGSSAPASTESAAPPASATP